MIQDLKPFLAAHPYFAGLSKDFIELAAGCAKNERFDVDDYIFREGDDADVFYLVRHGRVAVEMRVERKPVILATLRDGDVLGWSWLLPPQPWRFDARAVKLTRVVSLDCHCLRDKCEQNNSLGFALLKRSAADIERQLYDAWTQIVDVYGPPRSHQR